MAAGEFNILADQGSNYVLYFVYEENDGTAIDLDTYTGRMQIRRSPFSSDILVSASGNTFSGGITGGGLTGYYNPDSETGVSGTGKMLINASSGGKTGSEGTTGGVYISFDSTTMTNIPHGRHVYDVELISGSTVTSVLRGRFEVRPEVTR